MEKNRLQEEASDVVLEPRFLSLLAIGYHAEVIASQDAFTKAALWNGAWHVRVVSQYGDKEYYLATERQMRNAKNGVEYRVFKTANGLISHLHGMGFTIAHIPLEKGGVSRLIS